uniref:Gustatory receptor n=1 Tax=Tribolium castaneum TaxID=7070 RepID=A2AX78_TRICA|nr:gustatory receptor candidate 16 [Tribolium castaneum]
MPQVKLHKHYVPIILLSKILGIAPISYKNSNVNYSKIGIVQTVAYFVIFIILTIVFFEKRSALSPFELIQIRTINFVATFRTIANIILMAVLFLGTFIGRAKFLAILKQMRNLEPEFLKLDQLGATVRNNRQIRRMVVFLIGVSLSFNLFGDLLTLFIKEELDLVWREVCTFVVQVYPRLVVNTINLTFLTLLMILEGRFRVINDGIQALINDSRKVTRFPTELTFCNKIKHLVNLHKNLVKVAKDHNSLYSLHLLLWITVTFILLVGDSYIVMYVFFFHLSDVRYVMVVYLLKNVVLYGLELFILAKIVTDLCQEANSTKKLIVKIKIDIDKEDERNEVISSALKLSQNELEITACKFFSIDNALLFSANSTKKLIVKIRIDIDKEDERNEIISSALKLSQSELEITACKFFSIDNALLLSICGASSSYLFIMIQLDLGNKKNETSTILVE